MKRFAVVGFLVCLAGVVMHVTPGPGILVIIVGLTMLAQEFAWAERWLERLVHRVEQAVDQVTHESPLGAPSCSQPESSRRPRSS